MSKSPNAKTLILYSLYALPYDKEHWKVPPLSADIVDAEFIDLPCYTGPNIKINFPNSAKAKIDIRVVSNQGCDDILRKLKSHFEIHDFPELEIRPLGSSNWSNTPLSADIIQAQINALKMFGMGEAICPIYYASTPLVVFPGPPVYLPVANMGLGRMRRFHEANEYITVKGVRAFEEYCAAMLY